MTKLALLLPAYNEATVLPWTVETLEAYARRSLQQYDWRIVVVDNGSTDNTATVIAALQPKHPQLEYFRIAQKGRGNALRHAWQELDFDVSLYMDVDLAVALDAVVPVLTAVMKDEVALAVGSRYAKGAKVERSIGRSITSVGYNILTRFILGLRTRDAQCGFKAIRKPVAMSLVRDVRDGNWFFDTELLALAEHRDYHIVEVPVSWVETRPVLRKSKVKVLRTIIDYIWSLLRLRWQFLTHRRS